MLDKEGIRQWIIGMQSVHAYTYSRCNRSERCYPIAGRSPPHTCAKQIGSGCDRSHEAACPAFVSGRPWR